MITKAEHIKWDAPDVVTELTDQVMAKQIEIHQGDKLPVIDYNNALCDVMDSDEYFELTKNWLACEIECCDARDKVNAMVRARVYDLVKGLKK